MTSLISVFSFFAIILLFSCTNKKTNFSRDLQFLQKYDKVIVLSEGEASVIVSPKYQGKVFTSTSDGKASFGWIHYSAFDGPLNQHMNAYGGENRLWLGPEGGKYSLFFTKDAKMEFANWKTPAAFDNEPWNLQSQDAHSVLMQKQMILTNYTGSLLDITIERKISLLSNVEIENKLGISVAGVKSVGYQTDNLIRNTGAHAWTDTTGAPCIWILDMFPPSDQTTIVIPYRKDAERPATTDYFGEIPAERVHLKHDILFFKADGKSRGKLGIHPTAAGSVAGSYNADKKELTITLFDIDNSARYLNQEWKTNKPPFSGDAVNAYNDGPLADGKQMGPFYEIESVSPAAFLQPNESLMHKHCVFHFSGEKKGLDQISKKVFGISLKQISDVFK